MCLCQILVLLCTCFATSIKMAAKRTVLILVLRKSRRDRLKITFWFCIFWFCIFWFCIFWFCIFWFYIFRFCIFFWFHFFFLYNLITLCMVVNIVGRTSARLRTGKYALADTLLTLILHVYMCTLMHTSHDSCDYNNSYDKNLCL